MTAPQRCPCHFPQKSWICEVIGQSRINVAGGSKVVNQLTLRGAWIIQVNPTGSTDVEIGKGIQS